MAVPNAHPSRSTLAKYPESVVRGKWFRTTSVLRTSHAVAHYTYAFTCCGSLKASIPKSNSYEAIGPTRTCKAADFGRLIEKFRDLKDRHKQFKPHSAIPHICLRTRASDVH
jgi:hypothetical protein